MRATTTAVENATEAQTRSAGYQPADLRRLEVWGAHSDETIYPLQWQARGSVVKLQAARGEATSAQIVLRTAQSLGEVVTSADSLSGLGHARIGQEQISIRRLAFVGRFRDVLLPCDKITLGPGENELLWVTVRVPREARAGVYSGKIRISSRNGKKVIPLRLTVWGFTLPETPSLPAVVGISDALFRKRYGLTPGSSEMAAAQDLWYRMALDYRLSPYFCQWSHGADGVPQHHAYPSPWPLDHPRTRKYLQDPRLGRFAVAYFDRDEAHLRKDLAFLKARGWLDRAYFYLADEPQSKRHYAALKRWAQRIHAIEPRARILTTYFCGPKFPPYNGDLFAVPRALANDTDIYCMSIWAAKGREDTVAALRAALAPGQEWWSYACCGPDEPMPNLFARMSGFAHRAVMWRVWKEDHQGWLYWALNATASATAPDSPISFRSDLPFGDGLLIYPGEPFGARGPVASVRLERLREGLQDYEYLTALAAHVGRDKALRCLERIYRGPAEYTSDAAAIERFRTAVARMLGLGAKGSTAKGRRS